MKRYATINICQECKKSFAAYRVKQKYCSNKCAWKTFYRENKKRLKEAHKEHYEAHKERSRDVHQKYYNLNKEHITQKHKEWCEANKEQIRIRRKLYNDTHKEQSKKYWESYKECCREHKKEYYEANKERIRIRKIRYRHTDNGRAKTRSYDLKRYTTKKEAFVENVNTLKLYEESDKKCFYCDKDLAFKEVEIDHYMPLSKGGKHEKRNLRISCKSCNRSKHNKLPERWLEEIGKLHLKEAQ